MKTLVIEIFYSTPKTEGKEAFLRSEIERHIISEFAQNLTDMIEKTEREHCDEYRLKLNVLTDDQLTIMVSARALQMMLDGQVV